jgi:AraC-like DNA-binding protein
MPEISRAELEAVFKDFYNLTKFKIVFFDKKRRAILSYPNGMCRFCEEVRRSPELCRCCFECDERGFDMCDESGKPYIYQCHMSVVEAIAPIFAGESTVGYLMFGQILESGNTDIYEIADRVSEKHGISLTREMICEMTIADGEYIASAVNMMSMCASYLYTGEIIRGNRNILAERVREYVDKNLQTVSLGDICERFFISRSKLYSLSKDSFGMGISDYIRRERISYAKKLLRSSDLSVAEIALAVGMDNTNYFIRVFKESEGVTPLKYRKDHN